jgi:prepilin-type N-terminal cleavage/methylation domain-containing protein
MVEPGIDTRIIESEGKVRMKSKRGFTLVELMVVVAILAVFLALSVVACKGMTSGDETKKAATHDAEKFVKELGWQVTGISCTDIDSDGDGYVSCTKCQEGRHDRLRRMSWGLFVRPWLPHAEAADRSERAVETTRRRS